MRFCNRFFGNTITLCLKYYALETSHIRILAFQSSANLLVEYENVQGSQQNHRLRLDVLYSNMQIKKKNEKKTLHVNIMNWGFWEYWRFLVILNFQYYSQSDGWSQH